MGEESAIKTKHRNEDTMIESNQQNASAADDKMQHSESTTIQRDSDQSRQVVDKKNDNGHSDNGNTKRPKTVCYDFKKGFCRRRFCRVSCNVVIYRFRNCIRICEIVIC